MYEWIFSNRFFFVYKIYYFNIIIKKKYIVPIAHNSILASYFIMRIEVIVIYVKITRNDKLRPIVQ